MVELYVHSPIRLHGVVLDQLSIGDNFTFYVDTGAELAEEKGNPIKILSHDIQFSDLLNHRSWFILKLSLSCLDYTVYYVAVRSELLITVAVPSNAPTVFHRSTTKVVGLNPILDVLLRLYCAV
jgi:hypothetical protein